MEVIPEKMLNINESEIFKSCPLTLVNDLPIPKLMHGSLAE